MSAPSGLPPIRLSILDRLLAGDEADNPKDAAASSRALRASIRRDLEMLFNTRPSQRSSPPHLDELKTSVLTYGLSDLQTRPLASPEQRETFRRQFQEIVARFEPRLRDVSVEIPSDADPLDRTLRFRIHGLLVTETGTDVLVYDTAVDPSSRNLSIIEGDETTGR
jgi:type VI secretion system protein ImpF